MNKAPINIENESYVKGLGTVVYTNDAPFDEALKAVAKDYEILSARDLACARMHAAEETDDHKDLHICNYGSYVREGALFMPKSSKKRIWLRESILLQNPSDVSKEMDYAFIGLHLEKVGKENYLFSKQLGTLSDQYVQTNRFDEDERTEWLFQDMAKDYGLFLKDHGIRDVCIWMFNGNDQIIDKEHMPFSSQIWIQDIFDRSSINSNRNLSDPSCIRGLLRDKNSLDDVFNGLSKYVPEVAHHKFKKDLGRYFRG